MTKREKEVLRLVSRGLTDKEISEDLVISIKTVETHKHNIKEKLQVKRLADLIRYSIDHNLDDEEW
ncbi:response regulator transcription factor [Mesobacillus selenatarsenatis]|uniref:response regulator transcription factor n=1 Tax=Mesobacillus selenatarsenatis TaxID=388741 RepID=UPI00069321F3|nr:helix-turn-helix transcriptional regulator [Mesobacillus selenatarsenatis]